MSKHDDRPILGIRECARLNLVRRVEQEPSHVVDGVGTVPEVPATKEAFIKAHEEVFSGMGMFSRPVRILVDESKPPSMHPPLRYNFSTGERLKVKLNDLEAQGIVAKIKGEMPKYIRNLVIREKSNGDLRLCLDPEKLNEAIIRQKYPTPTLEEISCRAE